MNAEDPAVSEFEEEQAVAYLRRHPNLLSRFPDLLETIELAHDSGSAVSLIERQVELLRGRNARLQDRLDRLVYNARENENRVLGLQRLACALLRAPSLASVVAALKISLRDDFAIDELFVGLLAPGFRRHDIEGLTPLEPGAPIPREFENFFRTRLTECGPLTQERAALLFPRAAEPPRSAALAALGKERPLGMLVLAARDAQRFTPRQGTLFVELTAELAYAALRARLSKSQHDG